MWHTGLDLPVSCPRILPPPAPAVIHSSVPFVPVGFIVLVPGVVGACADSKGFRARQHFSVRARAARSLRTCVPGGRRHAPCPVPLPLAQPQAARVLPLLLHVQNQEPKGLLEALTLRCRGQSRQDGPCRTWGSPGSHRNCGFFMRS